MVCAYNQSVLYLYIYDNTHYYSQGKICAEYTIPKKEIIDLNFTNNASVIALKSAKKENKEARHEHEKKVKLLEEKMKELVEFKSEKTAEQKAAKSRAKKVDKKMKQVEEK